MKTNTRPEVARGVSWPVTCLHSRVFTLLGRFSPHPLGKRNFLLKNRFLSSFAFVERVSGSAWKSHLTPLPFTGGPGGEVLERTLPGKSIPLPSAGPPRPTQTWFGGHEWELSVLGSIERRASSEETHGKNLCPLLPRVETWRVRAGTHLLSRRGCGESACSGLLPGLVRGVSPA